MIQTILDWLHEHHSDDFIYYLIFLVTTCIVWFVAKIYFEKIKGSEKKIKELPCAKHEDSMRSLDKTIVKIHHKLDKLDKLEEIFVKHEEHFKLIDENMTKIITILTISDPDTTAAFSLKHSPSQLNEVGEKLYNECGGDKMLTDNGNFLIKLMEKDFPETALDVENKAYEVLLSNSYMSIFNHLKQWVYNCPEWIIDSKKYTITMKDVCYVLSLKLRDLYLKKHPKCQTEED